MPGVDGRWVELEAGSLEHVTAVTFHLEQLRRRAPGDYLLRLVASHLSFIRSHLSGAMGNSGSVISAMGEAAVNILLENISAVQDKRTVQAVHRKLAPDLVVRESTTPIA